MSKEERELVSVIIPVYNGERYLSEAIENILAQDYRPIEIIVVNDGSTDNSEIIAQHYEKNIMYVLQENRGPSAARNKGIRIASGDIIGFLDVDDLWTENKLSVQLACLADNPPVEIVLGLSQPMRMQVDEKGSTKFEKWLTPFCSLVVGAGLFRRSVFRKVGFFDETLYQNEDTDWFMRIREMGIPIKVTQEVSLFYRRHGGNITLDSAQRNRYFIKSLKKSLDRRRGKGSGKVEPLCALDFETKESAESFFDSAEKQGGD